MIKPILLLLMIACLMTPLVQAAPVSYKTNPGINGLLGFGSVKVQAIQVNEVGGEFPGRFSVFLHPLKENGWVWPAGHWITDEVLRNKSCLSLQP